MRAQAWRVAAILLALTAAVLIVLALLYALRPFGLTVDLSVNATVGPKALTVEGRCRAAAHSAWNRDPKDQLKLWAVSVGTNMQGYTPAFGNTTNVEFHGEPQGRFPDAFCSGEARHRLIVSGFIAATAAAAGVLSVVIIRRRKKNTAANVCPAS